MGTYPGGNIVRVTPTVVAGTTHADDVAIATTAIPNAVANRGGVSLIHNIFVHDQDVENHDIDIVFLKSNVSLGTINSAVTADDDEMKDNLLGAIRLDHNENTIALASVSSIASFKQIESDSEFGSPFPFMIQAGSGSTDVYFSLIARQEADWAATDDLTLIFHIQYLG